MKSLDLKWQIRLDKNYVRVAISENAELVALATLTRSKVDQTSVYSISILSGKDGSFISSLKEREISGHEPLHAMTIDDAGRRISLWWSFGNSIFEGVHDLDDGRLIPYKLDLRKPSGFNYFSRVIVDGSARFLLFQNGSCFSLWQNLSGEPHQDKLFNLFNIDLADYAIKNPAARDYLPGLEPVIDYSEQLPEEKLYELLSVLLSARTGTTVRYLVCEPSDVKNLLQKQDLKKEFLRKAQNEEQNGNLNAALMIYSDIVNLGGIQQEEILCKRHKILQKLGNSKVLKCWHERTHDYYWQSNMFGLAWFNERLLMQSHGMLAAAEMPDLRPDSSRLFRWVPPQNEVMIGVGSYKDNFLIYSHETEAPYLNKLSLCRLEGHDLNEIGCLAYDAAPEWVWPLDKIAIIGSILFAEVRPGKLVRIDIAEGFSPREITLRNPVQFLKAVTVDGNACLFIAFAKKGLLLLAPDCRELDFPWSGEQEFEHLRIAAVSDDFSTVVYWKNGNLVVKNLRTQTTMNIWDQLICGNPLGFRPDLISVSPEGGAVAYIDIHKLIVKCSKTGKEVLSWYGQWPRPIKAIVFDGSSRWLLAITGTNTVEQFQLFWHQEQI